MRSPRDSRDPTGTAIWEIWLRAENDLIRLDISGALTAETVPTVEDILHRDAGADAVARDAHIELVRSNTPLVTKTGDAGSGIIVGEVRQEESVNLSTYEAIPMTL